MRAALLVLALTLAACQPSPPPETPTTAPIETPSLRLSADGDQRGLLDDFDDRVRSEAVWLAVADGGEAVETRVYASPGGYEPTSRFYLSVDVARPMQPGNADVNGTQARLTTNPGGLDATGFTGVSFVLQGTPGTYIVQLGSARVQDAGHYNAYVTLTDGGWTRFEVPFSQFKQEAFAAPVPWTGTDLTHLGVFAIQGGTYSFGLDDVRLY